MATETKEVTAEKEQKTGAKSTTTEKPSSKQVESVYTAGEIADNAMTLFKVRKECVVAALRAAGITTCAVSQAKEIVEAFMKKEVK